MSLTMMAVLVEGSMPAPAHLQLPGTSDAPRRARHWAVATLDAWSNPPADRDDLGLVVSELVANAVLHGSGPVRVMLCVDPDHRVRVEVTGTSEASEVRAKRGPVQRVAGRGLAIVEALSHAWGSSGGGGQLKVWAVLHAPSARDAPA
jgi:anti-sigma regulatory factor (Ser/Thr protein kinase)